MLAFAASAENKDIVIAPPADKSTDLVEALYVMIPGANVDTDYYQDPMVAV